MKSFTLKVTEIIQETGDTATICFRQPALKKVVYKPGQYLTLKVYINGRRYFRPYSFSSCPGIDAELKITIKRVPYGLVSNHLLDTLKPGDLIEVLEPLGDFVFDTDAHSAFGHVMLWGAGSGITPLISIARYVLHQTSIDRVTLIYGNRSYDSVIFSKMISEMQECFGDRFSVWHFHTQVFVEDSDPFRVKGRIDPAMVLGMIADAGDLRDTLHFICGPAGLKDSVKQRLAAAGLPAGQVFSEDFEVEKDLSALRDIHTQMVNIAYEGVERKVEVVRGNSILEAGLDARIDLPYSCQTGHCTICKGKIRAGEVKMVGSQLKTESLLPDECLLCCAYPLTDDVDVMALN
jgi:ring-1,2-phenylacetyl-CoA epoxidase subunit PaaE